MGVGLLTILMGIGFRRRVSGLPTATTNPFSHVHCNIQSWKMQLNFSEYLHRLVQHRNLSWSCCCWHSLRHDQSSWQGLRHLTPRQTRT